MQETGVPGENHHLIPSHWQLSHMPRTNPGSGERKLAESGNALDHTGHQDMLQKQMLAFRQRK